MESSALLIDAYGRIDQVVRRAVEGLDAQALAYRPDPGSNSIAWLVWHLTRIQDDHVSEIAGRSQAWEEGEWAARLGLEADPSNTGYGHGPEEVASIRPEGPEVLLDYHEAVSARTREYLATVDAEELDRIIDRSYDPPVSVGVRLVSVINDNLQHAGQARYLRGFIERRA